MAKNKVVFRTQYTERQRIVSEPGSRYKMRYELLPDDRGTMKLVPVAQDDMYEKIQSYKDDCDIHCILAKYQRTGDPSLLNRVEGFYADVSEMPRSLAEFQQIYESARAQFDDLPADVRARFNNNYREYIALAGSKEWFDKLGSLAAAAGAAQAAGAAGSGAEGVGAAEEGSQEVKNE